MKKKLGYIIVVHCICWLIFLSLPAIFVAGISGRINISVLANSSGWLYFTIYILIFYIHTNFLFPKLYFKRKYLLYFLSLILLGTFVHYLRPFDNLARHERKQNKEADFKAFPSGVSKQPADDSIKPFENYSPIFSNQHQNGGPQVDIVSIILFLLVIVLSITLVITQRWRIAVEKAARAEADKANAELSNLKARINPHFLFNTLNNIYSQAVMKDERTGESIMKLSNIMRYVTDDSAEDFVSMQSEINFISDYIELQRIRLGSKVNLDFSVSGNMENKIIAPLILITFIENIFKYGITNSEPSVISIRLAGKENSIHFLCSNRLFRSKQSMERTGTGIINTRKRLEHLYKDRYLLDINEANGHYTVRLTLQTK